MSRLRFGANKYGAFHLLLARWLRHHARPDQSYCYVTLGGTQLRDIESLMFMDPGMISRAVSMEHESDRYQLACKTATRMASRNIPVQCIQGSIYDYTREDDRSHIFFVDLQGTCAFSDVHMRFSAMFRDGTIREGDGLFITSYLGRNPGWPRIFQLYDGEFRALGLTDDAAKRDWFRRAHPSFTLFRALSQWGLERDISLSSAGYIWYYDTSPMGVYGYAIGSGQTIFDRFVWRTPCFHTRDGLLVDDAMRPPG
jgi:hypothetical protein